MAVLFAHVQHANTLNRHIHDLLRFKKFFLKIIREIVDLMEAFYFGEFFFEVATINIKDSVFELVCGRGFYFFIDPAVEFFQACYCTTDDEVIFSFNLFGTNLLTLYIFQANTLCYTIYYSDFFTNRIHQVKFRLRKKDRQWNSWKAATCAYVQNFCSRIELHYLRDAKRMQYMIHIKVLNVLSRHHIDLIIPIAIERK